MQVFVREDCTMIAAPVQCDVDGVPKGSHFGADYDVTAKTVERAIGREAAIERGVELRQEQGLGLSR